MMVSDNKLISTWQSTREPELFVEIVSRHSQMVYATCLRVLGNGEDARDVAQECFLELSRHQSPIGRSLGGWLHVVAVRRSLDWIRAEKRRRQRESDYAARQPIATTKIWLEIEENIDEAIDALGPDLREAVIRRFLYGESHEQVAAALGISRSTAIRRLDRGIKSIQAFLRGREIIAPTTILATLLGASTVCAVPASLTGALGKLALAGSTLLAAENPGGIAVIAKTIGGILAMKKLALAGVALGTCVLFGVFIFAKTRIDSEPAVAAPPAPKMVDLQPRLIPPASPPPAPADPPVVAAERVLEPPPDPAMASIAGRIVDTEGDPLVGAEFTVYADGDHFSMNAPTESRTVTDSTGRFGAVELKPGAYSLGIKPAKYLVVRNASQEYFLSLAPGEQRHDLILVYGQPDGQRLWGAVTDPEGLPIPDAFVEIENVETAGVLIQSPTGADGAYLVESLPPGDYTVLLSAWAKGGSSD